MATVHIYRTVQFPTLLCSHVAGYQTLIFLSQNLRNTVMVCLCGVFILFPACLPGLCNRLQREAASLPRSFSITPFPCAGHQMTSRPPEELSSFFISAAALLSSWSLPRSAAHPLGSGTSACLRIRDRLAPCPSVTGSDWALTLSLRLLIIHTKMFLISAFVCALC